MDLFVTALVFLQGVNSKGVPGTDCEGMYLVRELVNYADSLRNVINSYVAINTEWLPEVLMCCTITIISIIAT